MRAARLAEPFLDGIFLGEVGIAQNDAVLGNVGCGLCKRTKRGDSGIQDVKAARAVMCKEVDNVGEHRARGLKAYRSGSGVLKEGRIEAVVDGRGDNHFLA